MSGVKGRSGGNNRKSIEELKLQGTYEHGRHAGHELKDSTKVKPEASILGDFNVDRKAIFNRFAEILHDQQLTAAEDSFIVSQLTDTYCSYVQVSEVLVVDGVEAKVGNKLAITLQMEIAKELRSLLAEFRLSPSTRAQGTRDASKEAKDDPVGAFLGKPKLIQNN
tara:strand:- start:682 stop:1179 length:498 start_codon:yes stop_codon:yes gene_type:complete